MPKDTDMCMYPLHTSKTKPFHSLKRPKILLDLKKELCYESVCTKRSLSAQFKAQVDLAHAEHPLPPWHPKQQ